MYASGKGLILKPECCWDGDWNFKALCNADYVKEKGPLCQLRFYVSCLMSDFNQEKDSEVYQTLVSRSRACECDAFVVASGTSYDFVLRQQEC